MNLFHDEPELAVTDDPEFQELLFLAMVSAGYSVEQVTVYFQRKKEPGEVN